MIKNAVVKPGVTPSVVSGKPSVKTDSKGEPLAAGEKVPQLQSAPRPK